MQSDFLFSEFEIFQYSRVLVVFSFRSFSTRVDLVRLMQRLTVSLYALLTFCLHFSGKVLCDLISDYDKVFVHNEIGFVLVCIPN